MTSYMSPPDAPLALPTAVVQRHYPDPEAMAAGLASSVAATLAQGVAQRGHASLVVPGGSSPVPFFERLSSADLPWAKVVIGLGDERCVPVDHKDSNAALVARHLMQGPAAEASFAPLWADDAGAPLAAAQAALIALKPPFDVVVLGMGEDGHFASLFPDAAALADGLSATTPGVLLVDPPVAPHQRVSMNVAALLATRRLILQVRGAKKREVLERAAREGDPMVLPISALLTQSQVTLEVHFCA